MADERDAPREALEPLDYLTRSEHRVTVLDALTATIPKPGLATPSYEPRELREMTGASEATISRILNEFDTRGWAERDVTGGYTATPIGQSIAIEFAPLLDSMAAIQHLGDAVALLPLNELTIDLQHFSDATVREPRGPQPNDFSAFLTEQIAASSILYTLSYVPDQSALRGELMHRSATGDLDLITIFAEHIVAFLKDAASADVIGLLDAGDDWYTYDGHIPCNMFILDETVVFENSQVNGIKDGTAILTHDSIVREWALTVFERYQAESTAITAADLPD